jgi:methyl-accepting chemotaxis protein
MTLNNLRIGPRLGIGFGAVLALVCVIVAIAYTQLQSTFDGLGRLTRQEERASVARDWASKTQLNVTRAVAIAKASGQPDIENFFGPLIKRNSAEISELQKTLEAEIQSEQGKALMADAAAKRKTYLELRDELMNLVKQSDAPAAEALLATKVLPASDTYLTAMQAVQTQQAQAAEAGAEQLEHDIANASTALMALLAASLLVGGVMSWMIARSITVPLRRGVEAASVIAGGDLSQSVDSAHRDELGDVLRALGQMQLALRGLVSEVRISADSIGIASAEIATGNQDLSVRTEQTASNLQHTASSMEQLTGTVKQSADSARQANQLANSAAEVAARGGTVVSQVVATMDDINSSSKKIADIIGVIDGIAFQTNILALNAAVEAARAGEQGRGFAVVASEVRSLAQRSAEAAKEIKGLIGASVGKVQNGSRLVADAGRTMTEIVTSVQRVSDIIGEITAASSEQSQGINEVNNAVAQLDQMTQQNAALVEESAAAAESLKAQANKLGKVIGTFKLAHAAPAAMAPAPLQTTKAKAIVAARAAPAPTWPTAPAPPPAASLPAPTQAASRRAEAVAVTSDEWETF